MLRFLNSALFHILITYKKFGYIRNAFFSYHCGCECWDSHCRTRRVAWTMLSGCSHEGDRLWTWADGRRRMQPLRRQGPREGTPLDFPPRVQVVTTNVPLLLPARGKRKDDTNPHSRQHAQILRLLAPPPDFGGSD